VSDGTYADVSIGDGSGGGGSSGAAAIDTKSPVNQHEFDLPQHRCLDSFQYSSGISLELLENAAFPFASPSALPYR
jgi:hypothetical protein